MSFIVHSVIFQRRHGDFQSEDLRALARRAKLPDASLIEAVERAEKGLVDAELGGGIIKQRVARQGRGRSGGYRTLIAFRSGELAIFLFGFAKSERDNVEPDELRALQLIAAQWLDDPGKIARDAAAGILIKVEHEQEI